ncbi:MAG: ATP-dependent Clp protease ATP-binding subunit [Planctomycetota bacterium]|nr:MAG: ATP-dependent Clp protease ATP-binding subunit [Planctomycetota bacterium]
MVGYSAARSTSDIMNAQQQRMQRAAQMALAEPQPLDPHRRSVPVQRFSEQLREQIVGQRQAITSILDGFSRVVAGIRDRERPILTLLLLGPTGVGKTETVKALASTVFGRRDAFVRINCQEFANEGAVAKLFGAPPGYVGSEVDPLLSQDRLDSHHRRARDEKRGVFADGEGRIAKIFPQEEHDYLSIILFDEVEKAHPTVWNALLGLMDDGHLTLGNNETVDCTRSIVIMTTNVGAEAMAHTLQSRQVGFDLPQNDVDGMHRDLAQQAVNAAKEHFPYEFVNRFDDVICFRALTREDCADILDRMLQGVYHRLLAAEVPIILHPSKAFRSFLLSKGYDPVFGARPLRRTVENELVAPLARLIASEQILPGQVIAVGLRRGHPTFRIEGPRSGGIVV